MDAVGKYFPLPHSDKRREVELDELTNSFSDNQQTSSSSSSFSSSSASLSFRQSVGEEGLLLSGAGDGDSSLAGEKHNTIFIFVLPYRVTSLSPFSPFNS